MSGCKTQVAKRATIVTDSQLFSGGCKTPSGQYEIVGHEYLHLENLGALISDATNNLVINVTAGDDALSVVTGPVQIGNGDFIHFWGDSIDFTVSPGSAIVRGEVKLSADAGNAIALGTDGGVYAPTVPDIYVDGGTFNPATLLLTLTDTDGVTPDVVVNLGSLQGSLTNNGDGTYLYNRGDGVTTVLDTRDGISADAGNLLAIGSDARPFLDTSAIQANETTTVLSGVLATGNPIGVYTNEDGVVATLSETITTFSFDALAQTLTFVGEDGVATVVDITQFQDTYITAAVYDNTTSTLTLTDNNGATPDVSVNLSSLRASLLDNGDGTYLFDNGAGVTTVVNTLDGVSADLGNTLSVGTDGRPYLSAVADIVTTLTDNGDGTYVYTNEAGVASVVDTRDGVSGDVGNLLVLGTDSRPILTQGIIAANETTSLMVDNGDGTYTYTDEDGAITTIDIKDGVSADAGNNLSLGSDGLPYLGGLTETVTTLVDNGDGTFTYTSEDATAVTFDAHTDANRAWGTADTQRTNANDVLVTDSVFHTGLVAIGMVDSARIANTALSISNNTTIGAGHTVSGAYHLITGSGNTVSSYRNIVGGLNNQVTSGQGLVVGNGNSLGGNSGVVGGDGNVVTGPRGLLVGQMNTLSGTSTIAGGSNNTSISASNSVVTGSNHVSVGGDSSLVAGHKNTTTASMSVVAGYHNNDTGHYGIVTGLHNTVTGDVNAVFGQSSTVSGSSNIVGGSSHNVAGSGLLAVGHGAVVDADSTRTIVSGLGNQLTNVVDSLIVGQGVVATGNRLIAGGVSHNVSGNNTLVSGDANTVATDNGLVSGLANVVNGGGLTVFGKANNVSGIFNTVAGYYTNVTHNGVVVLTDASTVQPFASIANNEIAMRAAGGFRWAVHTDATGIPDAMAGLNTSSQFYMQNTAGAVTHTGLGTIATPAAIPSGSSLTVVGGIVTAYTAGTGSALATTNRAWGTSDTQRTNGDDVLVTDSIFHTGLVSIGLVDSARIANTSLSISTNTSIGTGHTVSGAYNLIAGTTNTVSSYRNIVGGDQNAVSAGANVVGGGSNTVTGTRSVVGGQSNDVSGADNLVGGRSNTAAAVMGLVSGYLNVVNGNVDAVSGKSNTVTGSYSLVGGYQNSAIGGALMVAGVTNSVTGNNSVAMGISNTVLGDNSAALSGSTNHFTAAYANSVIAGGLNGAISNSYATISGGRNNVVSGQFGTVSGGDQNIASGLASVVAGGTLGTASGQQSSVVGGQSNIASATQSAAIGGSNNNVSGQSSVALAGYQNAVHAQFSAVTGTNNNIFGQNNLVGGQNNYNVGSHGIVAGYNNSVSASMSVTVGQSNAVTGGGRSFVTGFGNAGIAVTDSVVAAQSIVSATGNRSLISGIAHTLTGVNDSVVSGTTHNVTSSQNAVFGSHQTVSGSQVIVSGTTNTVSGSNNVVIGSLNSVTGGNSFVGGYNNTNMGMQMSLVVGQAHAYASGNRSLVGGYHHVLATNDSLVVGTTQNVSGGGVSVSGISNTVTGQNGSVTGNGNNVGGSGGVIGGYGNTVSGSSNMVVGSSNNVGGTLNIVGGASNVVASNASLVNGGSITMDVASGNNIAGGQSHSFTGSPRNVVSGNAVTMTNTFESIVVGDNLQVTSPRSVVAGYAHNITGSYSAVFGQSHTVNATHATAFGLSHYIAGNFGFATGRAAFISHSGATIIKDTSSTTLSSVIADEIVLKANGGIRAFTNDSITSGATMAAGTSSWVAVSDSSTKTGLGIVDGNALLSRLSNLNVHRYSFKSDETQAVNIGVYADEFNEAFGDILTPKRVGELHGLSHQDVDGVLVAAVKALLARLEAVEARLPGRPPRLATV